MAIARMIASRETTIISVSREVAVTGGNQSVTLEREGPIAVVRLARAHGNAINDDLVERLVAALAAAESDPEVGGVLLAASGKIFCPGLDLQELFPLDRPAMERFMTRFSAAVLTLYAFPKPVVAALHGAALAGGCVLGICADWRVLGRGTLIGLNEVKVGVPLPYGVALIVREAVPRHAVTAVALLGRNFTDADALAAGLADEIAEPDAVAALARERLSEFIGKDAASFSVTKRYLRSPVVERIRTNSRLLLPEWLDGWFAPTTRARIGTIIEELKGKK
jgi:Delta3-Delta2-enoyl-CoA isomerase